MVLFTNDKMRNMMKHNMKYRVYIMYRCYTVTYYSNNKIYIPYNVTKQCLNK